MAGKKKTTRIAAGLALALLMCAAPCQPVFMLYAAAAVQAAPVTENSTGHDISPQSPAAADEPLHPVKTPEVSGIEAANPVETPEASDIEAASPTEAPEVPAVESSDPGGVPEIPVTEPSDPAPPSSSESATDAADPTETDAASEQMQPEDPDPAGSSDSKTEEPSEADSPADPATGSPALQPDIDEPSVSEAPPAVQTLTIQRRTGLPGSEDYETAATFSYEELLEKAWWEYDYTFIDPEAGVIIDHAKGVSLRTLLSDAGIALEDVAELIFLSEEEQLTLPASDLLDTDRYCHFGLPDHYDDGSYLTDPMVALFHQRVEVLLAVQDHWMPVSEGGMFWSNPADMTAENAFRLVFGQADVTESRAEAALSRIHTIRVLPETGIPAPADGEQDTEAGETPEPSVPTGGTAVTDQETPESPTNSGSIPMDDHQNPEIQGSGSRDSALNNHRQFRTIYPGQTFESPTQDADSLNTRETPEREEKPETFPVKSPEPRTAAHSNDPVQLVSDTAALSPLEPSGEQSPESGETEPQPLNHEPSTSEPRTLIQERESPQPALVPDNQTVRNPARRSTTAASAGGTGTALSGSGAGVPRIQEILLNTEGTPLDIPSTGTTVGPQTSGNRNTGSRAADPSGGDAAEPSVDESGSDAETSPSGQPSPPEESPASFSGDGLRVFEMSPVPVGPDSRGKGFIIEEYSVDSRLIPRLVLDVVLLFITGGLIYYLKEYRAGESEQHDETIE